MKTPPSSRREWGALLALLAAALLPLRRCIAGTDMIFLADAFHRFFPGQAVLSRVLAAAPGRIPAWDPFLFCGSPLLADPARQVLYPPALLFRVLPYPQAMGWFLGLHVLLALAGVAELLRRRGCGPRAAVIGALGFGLGVHAILLQAMPPVFCAYAWLPWIAVAALRVGPGDGWRGALGLSVCGGWLVLAGAPMVLPIAVVLAVVVIWTEAGSRWRGAAASGALGVAGAALLAVGMLAPYLSYLPGTTGTGMADVWRDAVAPWDLLGCLVPRALLTHEEGVLLDPTVQWATLHAPGILLVALAVSGWWLRRGDAALRAPLRLVAVGVVLGMGPWVRIGGWSLWSFPPLSRLGHPGLWMELADLGVAWLAGIGAHELEARLLAPAGRRVREGWLVGIVFLASVGLGSHGWQLGAPAKFIATSWGAFAVDLATRLGQATDTAVLLVVGFTFLWLASRREISVAWAFRCIGILAFLDAGVWMGNEFQPRLPAARLMAPSAEEGVLARVIPAGAWGRVFVTPHHQLLRTAEGEGLNGVAESWRGSLRSDLPAAGGWRDASGDSPLRPAGVDALLDGVTHAPHTPTDAAARRVFDSLGVRVLIARRPIAGLEPVAAGHARLFRRSGTLRPAWIEPASAGTVVTAASPVPGAWTIQATLERPGTLVVAESAVGGWRIAEGPAAARQFRALGALVAVELPAGRHAVRLAYDPPVISIGLVIALAALAGLLGWSARDWWRARA